jgi:photosystem II stability/assembly factor-like uncharacterized protein
MNLRMMGIWLAAVLPAVVVPFRGAAEEPGEDAVYAAVSLVRGSVVGSHAGEFGPFLRKAGSEWQRLSPSHVICYGIAIGSSRNGRELYLAGGNGLHHTSDGGRSWRILTGWTTREVLTVVSDPASPTNLLIGTAGGAFRSRDAGKSWHECPTGLGSRQVKVLGPDPRSSTTLYALADDGLYRTTDGGDMWIPLGIDGLVVSFWQNSRTPEVMVAGVEDGGLLRSTDDGTSWHSVQDFASATVYALAGDPQDSLLYAAGWETGIWRSADRGASWERLGDIAGVNCVFCISVHPQNSGHLFAGTDGQGVFESLDGGRSWRFAGLAGGKVKQVLCLPQREQR